MATEGQTNEKTQEDLFEEIMAAKQAGKSYDKLVNEATISDAPVEENDEPNDEGTPPAEEPEAIVTSPVEEVKEETTPAKAEDKLATTVVVSDDWEASLPDEVKEKVKALREERNQLEHRVKSELGRLPFLQRKVDELSRQRSEPQTKPVKEQPAATKTSTKFDEKIAEARAVDPALADLLVALKEEIENPLREEFSTKVKQTEELVLGRDMEQHWHNEKARLLQMVPQADDVFKHPLWKEWKENVATESMRNLTNSVNADDMVVALEVFSKYVAVVQPELVTPPAETTKATTGVVDTTAADKVAAERARKLAGTPKATTATTPKASTVDLEDPEALFNHITGKIAKGESYKV